METIRKIIHLSSRELTVTLPENYNGLEVEVIIRPVTSTSQNVVKEPRGDYNSLYGSIALGANVEGIHAQLRRLRDQWNRDIS